ncbi:MAG TPA: hypothetical protein P5346_09690 [Spirochaetota bacterium]|nr:hypothetical protein [Spirochaetota bacterium]HSA14998.1 hypothetical protein [Spirochaetota bacterium]
MADFLGDDILINDDLDAVIAVGSGDFSTVSGVDCVVQDIIEELSFPYGDDPSNPGRGNRLMQFTNCDADDQLAAIEMAQEVKAVLYRDPRVKAGSVQVTATPGAEGSVVISFTTISGQVKENLVVPISSEVRL